MSNCINIVDEGTVLFDADELDWDAFLMTCGKVKACTFPPEILAPLSTSQDDVENIFWWFLQSNSKMIEWTGLDGIFRRRLMIQFGRGRSGHTVRDFYQTLDVLAEYVLMHKKHRFYVTDEYDGHRERKYLDVDFAVGRPNKRTVTFH